MHVHFTTVWVSHIPLLDCEHSKKNWSVACALRGNKSYALLGNALLCARWTLQVLGHLSAQEVSKFVYLRCKLPEDVPVLCTQVSKNLKCPSGAQPCSQKCIPSTAQGLLPMSTQASFQVVHSSSYCCGST